MFMVGGRMTRHFQFMGLETIGKLAATPLDKLKLMMRRKLGKNSDINAELYWSIANGLDHGPVTPGTRGVTEGSRAYDNAARDYGKLEEIRVYVFLS